MTQSERLPDRPVSERAVARSPERPVASWVWALLPMITVGIANPGVFLVAAVRRRSPAWWLAFAAYTAVTVVMFVLIEQPDGSTAYAIGSMLALLGWVVGSAHALAVRRRVFAPGRSASQGQQQALEAALAARDRRRAARDIVATDRALALELRIGRPDLPRQYDDGGLVDVNSAPAVVLQGALGLEPATAARVVEVRDQAGGFSSVEDLAVLLDLPPSTVDGLREHAVFVPR
jgi:DNA uptake protein ComE-like DNA-binding protein